MCRDLTGRFDEAAAMATDARAAGRERHDRVVQIWGLLVLIESRLRVNPGDPAIASWLEEADQLVDNAARIAATACGRNRDP